MAKLISGALTAQKVDIEVAMPKLQEPKKYKVVLMNDDYTPMEFVVEVLEHFFHLPEDVAIQVMMKVHTEGRAVCGLYTRDVAETKVISVNEFAKMNDHPLLCCMEQE